MKYTGDQWSGRCGDVTFALGASEETEEVSSLTTQR